MKKHTIFCFKSFNDIDHITPLFWFALSQNESVIILWFGEKPIEEFPILYKIIEKKKIKYYSINKGLLIKKMILWNFFACVIFLIKNNVQRIIVDWFRPNIREIKGQLFLASKILGLKCFALPHGYFIYKNDDFNDKINEEGRKDSFKKRNQIYKYYLNNLSQKEIFVNKGLNESIVAINGNMRFSKLWHNYLLENHFQSSEETIKVLFFTPHWSYNVNKEETLRLIDRLIDSFSPSELKISLHTRGSGDLTDKKYLPYLASQEELSGQLIRNSNITICFGSSIIFEAILQKKFIINPKYLHTNTTIYDDYDAIFSPDSEQQTLKYIEEILNHSISKNSNQYDEIIFKHVYQEKDEEPIISFYDQIFR